MSFNSNVSWASSCLKELNLPGSPWHNVLSDVSKRLADRLKLEGLTYVQLMRVEKFIGADFIKQYKLVKSIKKTSDSEEGFTRLKTDSEVQEFLKDLTIKAATDAGCPMSCNTEDAPSYFVNLMFLIKSLLKTSIENRKTESHQVSHTKSFAIPPACASDNMLIDILKNDPTTINKIVTRVKGKILSPALRKYIYRLALLKMTKRSAGGDGNDAVSGGKNARELTQQQIREKFALQVKRGLKELGSKHATKSPVSHIIDSSIVEMFEVSPGLKQIRDDMKIQQGMSRVLNILYTHSRKCESFYPLLLVPLQVALCDANTSNSREYDYQLSMWANLLIAEVLPAWRVVNDIAVSAWSEVLAMAETPNGFKHSIVAHLQSLGVGITKSDVVRALETERFVQKSYSSAGSEISIKASLLLEEQIHHPVVFIRMWVMHLFVGLLEIPIVLFLWDQLFLHDWDKYILKQSCKVLLYCLKDDILLCPSMAALRELFIEGLSKLRLSSVIRLWRK